MRSIYLCTRQNEKAEAARQSGRQPQKNLTHIIMQRTETTTVELHERIEFHARCERTVSISEAPGSFPDEIRTTIFANCAERNRNRS